MTDGAPSDDHRSQPVSGGTPTELDWAIRTAIYQNFATTGAAPSYAVLAEQFERTLDQVSESITRLLTAHEIAPFADGTGVFMANPFSAVATDYAVETAGVTVFANCAWDALGVPAILGTDGWIRTHCAERATPLEFGIRDGALTGDEGVIHMVVPIRDAWVDIGFT